MNGESRMWRVYRKQACERESGSKLAGWNSIMNGESRMWRVYRKQACERESGSKLHALQSSAPCHKTACPQWNTEDGRYRTAWALFRFRSSKAWGEIRASLQNPEFRIYPASFTLLAFTFQNSKFRIQNLPFTPHTLPFSLHPLSFRLQGGYCSPCCVRFTTQKVESEVDSLLHPPAPGLPRVVK